MRVRVIRAPTTSWWWKLTPPSVMARVRGLPDVVEQRGQAQQPVRVDVLSTTASVCASTSLCRWIGSCSSARPGSSGRNSAARPVRTTNHSASGGHVDHDILSSSSRMRSADTMDSRPCMRSHRLGQRRVGLEREAGGEPGGAQHAQRVVAERDLGVERRAQAAGRQVAEPVEGVDQLHVGQPQRQGVDGEVAAGQVDVDVVAEGHLGLARVGHVDLGPVGRDLVDAASPLRQPMVPKRAPWVQTSSAQPRTSRSISSGRASVVRSRSSGRRPRRRPGTGRRAPSRPPGTSASRPRAKRRASSSVAST